MRLRSIASWAVRATGVFLFCLYHPIVQKRLVQRLDSDDTHCIADARHWREWASIASSWEAASVQDLT